MVSSDQRKPVNLSVIIPAYQEAGNIRRLVSFCKDQEGVKEVIVADGGSEDATIPEAKKAGAIVLTAPERCRAVQMNSGASEAKAPILHFVHADTTPPSGFPADIQKACEAGYRAGCFRSRFDTNSYFLLANSFFTRFSGIIFRGGGQTLFIEAELFHQLGGYKESMKIMEEYELIQRIKKATRFKVIARNVIVSDRKYREKGTFRLQFFYACIFILFFLRIPQKKLIRLYQRLIQ